MFNFENEVLKSDKPVLVFFYRATGCANCEVMKPKIDSFEEKNPQITVIRLDADINKAIVSEYAPAGGWSLPLIFSVDEGQIIQITTWVTPEKQFIRMFKTLINMTEDEFKELELEILTEETTIRLENLKLQKRKMVNVSQASDFFIASQKRISLQLAPAEEVEEDEKKNR